MSKVIGAGAKQFVQAPQLLSYMRRLCERALECRGQPDRDRQQEITLFVCEPTPMYVFGTGVQLEPSSTLQSLRRHITGSCDMTPNLGDPYISNLLKKPLTVHSWRRLINVDVAVEKVGYPGANRKVRYLWIEERNPEALGDQFLPRNSTC